MARRSRRPREMKREIVIFGASLGGRRAIAWAKRYGKVVGFIDNNAALRGKSIAGRPVYPPSEIQAHPEWDVVISSEIHYKEMDAQLNALGIDDARVRFCPRCYLNGSREFPLDLLLWALGLICLCVGGGLLLFA